MPVVPVGVLETVVIAALGAATTATLVLPDVAEPATVTVQPTVIVPTAPAVNVIDVDVVPLVIVPPVIVHA